MKKSVWLIPVMLGAMVLLMPSSMKTEMAFDTGPEPMSSIKQLAFSTGPEPMSVRSAIFSSGSGPASFDPGPGPMWNCIALPEA